MYCIYHSRDFDGMASGAICKLKYPGATLIGYDYGQPIPYDQIPRNQPVIMVDVSILPEDMAKLALYTGRQLTWIDHHKSAIDDYEKFKNQNPIQAGYFKAILKQGIAACEITWNYLFPGFQMPTTIELLGQYDTWRNDNKLSWNMLVVPFQYGMKTFSITNADDFPMDLLSVNPMTQKIADIIDRGKIALDYQRNMDKQVMQSSFQVDFEGLRAIACNGSGFGSMAFDSVYNPENYDLMIPFKYDGENWIISLYTTKDNIDCSVLAKRNGGGGHQSAAGFTTSELPDFLNK